MAQVARQEQVQADGADREHQSDQALGEHVQGTDCRKAPTGESCGRRFFQRPQEKPIGKNQPESDHNVWNQESREDIGPDRCNQSKAGIKPSAFADGIAAQPISSQNERQQTQHERKTSAPVADSENFVTGSHAPVHQRRLFEVAHAVGVHRYPIVAEQHFPGCFRVDRVDVIEQRRRKHPRSVNRQPQ